MTTNTTDTLAAAFVKAHPWAKIEHAQATATTMQREGIPWCPTCADWHREDEEHSMTEDGW